MKSRPQINRLARYQFILDELLPIRPVVRRAFGFTYIYLDDKLLLSFRESDKQPGYNGVWLYTEAEHIESLRKEFVELPRRYFWRSRKSGSGWVILPWGQEGFEEYVYRACELVLSGDRRLGRVGRARLG